MTVKGLIFGIGAAAAFGGYTLLAGVVGRASSGFSGLALSVAVGALALLPFSVAALPRVDGGQWLPVAASGVIGVVVAYSLTFTATRFTSPRVVGTLMSADPAMGAIVGAVVLHQALTGAVAAGIVLVVVSGAAVIWLAGGERAPAMIE